MRVQSLGQEDPLEEGLATHFSILVWKIPWTEEPGWATVHGVSKSWTLLKRLSMHARTLLALTNAKSLEGKFQIPFSFPTCLGIGSVHNECHYIQERIQNVKLGQSYSLQQ